MFSPPKIIEVMRKSISDLIFYALYLLFTLPVFLLFHYCHNHNFLNIMFIIIISTPFFCNFKNDFWKKQHIEHICSFVPLYHFVLIIDKNINNNNNNNNKRISLQWRHRFATVDFQPSWISTLCIRQCFDGNQKNDVIIFISFETKQLFTSEFSYLSKFFCHVYIIPYI